MYKDYISYLDIFAFNSKEKNILHKNPNIINEKIKLSPKDIQIYFYLKQHKKEIGVTDLVRKCLTEQGYDVNDPIMYKPRKRPGTDEFYETGSFWGYSEYRVDSFSRALNKLIKVGLVKRKNRDISSTYSTVVKE